MLVLDRVDAARLPELVALFGSAWWAAGRDEALAVRILAGSDAVAAVVDPEDDRLVGFARAITDGVVLAMILDVIVAETHRRRGLGTRLIDALVARPELARVDSIELVCQPDLVDFYRRAAFTDDVGRSVLMRRTTNPRLVGPA